MNRNLRLQIWTRWVAVAVLLLAFGATLAQMPGAAASQVSGTSYTSPSYGYTITWELPWYVIEADADASGYELLRIADSRSEALFLGGHFDFGDSVSAIQQFAEQMETSEAYANVSSVEDPQCSTGETAANIATACYRADVMHSDGSVQATGIYLKAWTFGDGVTLLLRALTEESILPGYIPHWNSFGVFEAGAPLPTPKGACTTESHQGIEFCFDPALSEPDRSDIVEGVRLGQDAIATMLGDQTGGTVNVTGLNAISPSGDALIATTYGNAIAVYAQSTLWQSYTPIERIETLIHEYYHVFQFSMTESASTIVPLWFTEGSAESFGYTVASQIGVTDQAEFYSLALYELSRAPVAGNLRDFEASGSMGADEYPLAYMAVQYLLGSKGMSIEALTSVYQQIGNGSSFDTAFATVFGMSLDQFYAAFESWQLEMTPVYSLDDDFYPNEPDVGINQGAFSWTAYPQGEDHGRQLVFVAQTTPLVDCTMSLNLAGQSIQRATWANGQGEIFWLVSLSDDALAGTGYVGVDCGGISKFSVIAVT